MGGSAWLFAVNVGKKIVSVVLEKQPMCWVNNLEPLPFHEADQSSCFATI